jgi:hypothetical protein
VFCEHFWVTTSGFFSYPALIHCIQEIGIERVLFSIDYPFVENKPGTEWLARIPLAAEDKANAKGAHIVMKVCCPLARTAASFEGSRELSDCSNFEMAATLSASPFFHSLSKAAA